MLTSLEIIKASLRPVKSLHGHIIIGLSLRYLVYVSRAEEDISCVLKQAARTDYAIDDRIGYDTRVLCSAKFLLRCFVRGKCLIVFSTRLVIFAPGR